MRRLLSILQKFLPKQPIKPVGRWRIENCNKQMNNKVDLSNEDHCGPCGQYALEVRNSEKKDIEPIKKLK